MRMSIRYIIVRRLVGWLVAPVATAFAGIPEQLMTNGIEEQQRLRAASTGAAVGAMARLLVPFA